MSRELVAWISNSALGHWVVAEPWIWPTLESLHFVSLCVLMGGLLVIDLRLIGFFRTPCAAVIAPLVRLSLAAFAVNFLTGLLFFFGYAAKYVGNSAFELKLGLIVAAGINAIYYRLRLSHIADSDAVTAASIMVGTLSLLLWAGVIVCGRMITFYAP